MKFMHCFIDEHGNIWRNTTLKAAAKDIEDELFDPESISLDTIIRWKVVDLRDYIAHFKRVANANLSEPIILRPDGYPMDGWHRIVKAKAMGGCTLMAKRLKAVPPPDFRRDG